MSDCKAPCKTYKEQMDKLTSEINFLRNILFSYVGNILENPNYKITQTLSENVPSVLRSLVHPPALQPDAIQESERTRLEDGGVNEVDI